MKLVCRNSKLRGSVDIPGSKSHTIRAVAIAALAQGKSFVKRPLDSSDTAAAVRAYTAAGAQIASHGHDWHIQGTGGQLTAPDSVVDVGNSGTTLRIFMGSCALLHEGHAVVTGDEQIQRRPAAPLAESLNDLGARIRALNDNGCAPFEIHGRLRGGETTIECVTSQYLTSLLMCTPLAENDSTIHVPLLNEKPYVGITLDWIRKHGIRVEHNDDLSEFHIPGNQQFTTVDRRVPADFSSATFFLAAGALHENEIVCDGLDYTDTQGDKAVVEYLKAFGAKVDVESDRITTRPGTLDACELDLNATPDALPMMAAIACFAEGETRLVNVPQARIKETDRIAVMCKELKRMGADIEELEDGLIVRGSALAGARVDGHDDHRVVMALAIAGTAAQGETVIEGAEAIDITYPGFVDALRTLGADVETLHD